MTKWILILCLGLYLQALPAQNIISGNILSGRGHKIQGASVVLRDAVKNKTFAFSVTNGNGQYEISHNSKADSIYITVSHVSFKSKNRVLANKTTVLNWELEESTFDLPVMEVKSSPITKRGDTLVYSLKDLRRINDESLEDVLSNIPGIEIEKSGRILYQGLPISKFYIEGLDLLEGRYALATRNLNSDAILDIELIEEHQHIQALDGIVKPPNAAINLKLKSSVVFTGKYEAGTGFAPVLYNIDATVFGFQKRQQSNIVVGTNNIGKSQINNLDDLSLQLEVEPPIIEPQVIQLPFIFDENNFRMNRERLIGISLLRKISKFDQFKLHISVGTDETSLIGERQSILQGGNTSNSFSENLNAIKQILIGNGRLTWERNSPKLYVKSNFNFSFNNNNTDADNIVNSSNIYEDYKNKFSLISNETGFVIRKGVNAYRFWINSSYTDHNYNLYIDPFKLLEFDDSSEIISEQDLDSEEFKTDIFTRLFLKIKNSKINYRVGFNLKKATFSSNLDLFELDSQFSDINIKNKSRWSVAYPYIKQEYSFKIGKLEGKLNLPISIHFIKIADFELNSSEKKTLFVTNPRISLGKKFSNGGNVMINLDYDSNYDENQYFFSNSVLYDSRTLAEGSNNINRRESYSVSSTYSKRNLFVGTAFNSFVQYSSYRSSQIPVSIFGDQGSVFSIMTTQNRRQSINFSNRLERNIGTSSFADITVLYSYSSIPSILNNDDIIINLQNLNFKSSLSRVMKNSAVTFRSNFTITSASISPSNSYETKLLIEYFYKFNKNRGKINFSIVGNQTINGGIKKYNSLANVNYKVKLKKARVDLEVGLLNVTNARRYVTFYQSSFFNQVSLFQLRKRQLLISLKREF